MGDVLSIIEKAEESFSEEEAKKMEEQLRKQSFDLNDYLAQLRQVKKMGSFSSLLKMIPGMNQLKNIKVDDKEFDKIEAIICSMTTGERRNPKLLNASRRKRIANGSGTSVQEINRFMTSFETTQKMMKKIKSGKGMRNMMKNLNMNDLKDFKKAPFYHIVVADSRSPRDGKVIAKVGTYDPMTKPSTIVLDKEAVATWIKNGAKPTDTVKKLIDLANND